MKNIVVPEINYQEEIKNCKIMEGVVGKDGLMQKLFKNVMQQLLEAEMQELYGIDVSPSMISNITDNVVEAAAEWQSRMLDEVYPRNKKILPELINSSNIKDFENIFTQICRQSLYICESIL